MTFACPSSLSERTVLFAKTPYLPLLWGQISDESLHFDLKNRHK
jgi:hypothetical protein